MTKVKKSKKNRFKYHLSEKEKYANDMELAKEFMDDIIPHFSHNWIRDYDNLLANYRLYNNDITREDFDRVCNPLGIDIGQYDEEVLPYNKTYQKIDVLLGEEYKRGLNYTLALLNPKAIEQKDKELRELYMAYVQEVVNQEMAALEAELQGAPQDEIEKIRNEKLASKTPKDIEAMTFLSQLEILGNNVLQYGIHDQRVKDLKNDGFKHAMLSDKEFIYVGVHKGEPHVTLLNPLLTFYQKDPETRYIQDGDWAGHRVIMSVQKVLEQYGGAMDKKDIKKLEDRIPGERVPEITGQIDVNRESTLTNRALRRIHNEEYINEDLGSYGTADESYSSYAAWEDYVTVVNIEWKWLREIVIVETIDEYGEPQMDILDSSFPIPDTASKVKFTNKFGDNSEKWEWIDELTGVPYSVEKLWIPRVWEGMRIDEDIYVNVREKVHQPIDLDNPYDIKLGYHGTIFNAMNAKSTSLMERMKPFQFLFFVVLHQIKELIPKHIGPVQNIDTSMIDPNLAGIKGEDEFDEQGADQFNDALAKTLYYRQKGLNIYNSLINNIGGISRETNVSRPQPGTIQNMTVAQDLNNLITLLGWIDQQIGMAAGVSPQREAMFSSNTNVTDNQQAIVQSSHITEHYFRKHNSLWKEVLESYVNYAKLAWGGKSFKKQFLMQDGSLNALAVDPSSFENASFGLFITDTGRQEEYINKMEELALTFMQNDGSIEQISYILKARATGTSPEEVHREIVKLQKEKDERAAQQAESQNAQAENIQKMQIEAREDEQAHEVELHVMDNETKIRVAEIQTFAFQQDQDVNDNNIPDQLEIEKLRESKEKRVQESVDKEADRNLKREEIQSKERIESMKASQPKKS